MSIQTKMLYTYRALAGLLSFVSLGLVSTFFVDPSAPIHGVIAGTGAVFALALAVVAWLAARDHSLTDRLAVPLTVALLGMATVRFFAYAVSESLRKEVGAALVVEVLVFSLLGALPALLRPGRPEGVWTAMRSMVVGIQRIPWWLKLEGALAAAVLLIAPVFFWHHPLAKIWLLSQALNLGIASATYGFCGLGRLVGLGHVIPWSAPTALSLIAVTGGAAQGHEAAWLWACGIAGCIALIIDGIEVLRWMLGDRQVWAGAPVAWQDREG